MDKRKKRILMFSGVSVGLIGIVALGIFLFTQGWFSSREVVLEERIMNYEVSLKEDELRTLMEDWQIWEVGLFSRNQLRVEAEQLPRVSPGVLEIYLTHEEYPGDRLISSDRVITSARDEFNGKKVALYLGVNRDYVLTLQPQDVEYLLTQTLLTTLFYSRYTELEQAEQKKDLESVLIEYRNTGSSLFMVTRD